MFQAVRKWWRLGRGKATARLFVFELFVVVLGVLIAQGVANWAQDRGLQSMTEADIERLEFDVAAERQVARTWLAAIPCLENQFERVARRAGEGLPMDQADLARPRYLNAAFDDMPDDVENRIRAERCEDYTFNVSNIAVQSRRLRDLAQQMQTQRDRFRLLDPTLGKAASNDAPEVRQAAIAALALMRGIRVQASGIESSAADLDIAPFDYALPVQDCSEVWSGDQIYRLGPNIRRRR